MKKLIPMILALIAVLLTACGGPYKGREAEVEAILRPLVEKEAALLRYLYGDGFTTLDPVSEEDANYTTTAKYYRVSGDSPYHSVDALKAAIKEIYSEDRAAEISSGLFEGGFSRFSDYQVMGIGGEVLGTDLGIDVTLNHPPMELFTVVRPSAVTVKRSTASLIECEVDYTDSRNGSKGTLLVTLIDEAGTWKLDSSTWASAVE